MAFVLVLALFWQLIDVYLTFDGSRRHASAADGTRWVWTASTCVASAVCAVVAAFGTGSRTMTWTTSVTTVIAVTAAVIFAVPHDRWRPAPEPNLLPANYQPCDSGSNECN